MGVATSIFVNVFVNFCLLLRQKYACHDKHIFVVAKKTKFVITKVCLSRQTFVMTKIVFATEVLSQQILLRQV